MASQFDADALGRLRAWLEEQVQQQRIAGGALGLLRRGEQHTFCSGRLAVGGGAAAVAADSIFRIYSMTKPVTSVAVMMLYERGLFELNDPIAKYIPAFADMQVAVGGAHPELQLEKARSPITIHQLLTHTSGLTYW